MVAGKKKKAILIQMETCTICIALHSLEPTVGSLFCMEVKENSYEPAVHPYCLLCCHIRTVVRKLFTCLHKINAYVEYDHHQ